MYHYPAKEWQKTWHTQPFAAISSTIERERCGGDLLYAVLMHPMQKLGNGQTVIDRLICAGYEIATKKYAPDFSASRMIREGRIYNCHITLSDSWVKRFCFLHMLCWEPELQDLVRNAYKEGKHLWVTNEQARAHFDRFIAQLRSMIAATFQWPCSEMHMKEIVHNMVQAACKSYVTGR